MPTGSRLCGGFPAWHRRPLVGRRLILNSLKSLIVNRRERQPTPCPTVSKSSGQSAPGRPTPEGKPDRGDTKGAVGASSAVRSAPVGELRIGKVSISGREGSPLEGIEHLAYRLQATLGRPLSHRDIHGAQVRPLRKERNGVVTLHNSAGYLILLASQCDEETYVLAAPF
jgi:hypothetical protein